MKYYKTKSFPKVVTSTGFIVTLSCVLIALGAIGWFAFSKNANTNGNTSNNQNQSYIKNNNSYNSKVELPEINVEKPVTDTNESVNQIPYEDNNVQQQIEVEEEKQIFILPVEGNITKGFSDTALQYSATFNDMRLHTGIDILCKKGQDIKSIGTGMVKSIIEDTNFGKIIAIEYNKDITVKYCGMASIDVKVNDNVSTGDIIGTSGEVPSECADNPHIHIEVIVDGKCVSPLEALNLK